MQNFKFIDLFCGIGGFHQAMSNIGGECVFASDIDASCRRTYEKNYGIKPFGDITKIAAEEIPAHDVLCGGFPCQAFSKAGKQLGFQDPTKGTLFFDIIRIVSYHKPKYILLENVRNLASHDKGNTWRVIYNSLKEQGYNLLSQPVIFSPHYIGVPQHRERVFIMCIRNDVGFIPQFYFNEKTMPTCKVEDILQDDEEIPNLKHYQLDEEETELLEFWDEFIRNIKKPLPGFPVWTDSFFDSNPPFLQKLPPFAKVFVEKNNKLYLQNKAFIDDWLPRAEKCSKFFGSKAKLEWQVGQVEKPTLWNNILQIRPTGIRVKPGTYFPALVAMVQTSILGKRRRYLTPRECARLQSFPDTFKIDEREAQAYKQFGNSVNVAVVELFGRYLLGDPKVRNKYTIPCEEDLFSNM